MAIKLILDTDIGSDIDDAWALALCLGSKEIDLVGVTLVYADLDTRAKIALKMLKLAGRDDIPLLKGISTPLTPDIPVFWGGYEGTETDFSDIAGVNVADGAVDFIIETVEKFPGEVVLCSIGPMTNVGEAIRRAPDTMRKLKRLVIMGSTYLGDGPEAATREHNVGSDPIATKIAFDAGIPATVVGINCTERVHVRRDDLVAIDLSPFGAYLAETTRQYFGVIKREFTHMHDPLAVGTLIDPSVVTMRRMRAEVFDDGRIAFLGDPGGYLDVCVDVDVPKFEGLLVSRVVSLSK